MAKTLRNPELGKYSVPDHLACNKTLFPVCKKHEIKIDRPIMIDNYQKVVAQEEDVYRWVRKSEFTEKKQQADDARDKAFSGIMSIVRFNLKNFDIQMQNHAKILYGLLEGYGDITVIDYDAETITIDSIVRFLQDSKYFPSVEALGITPWINELETQNNLFKTYVQDSLDEKSEKPEISPKEARRMTDEALREIMKRVSALIDIEGADKYEGFIDEFNAIVDHYNTVTREHYGRIHAKTDVSAAEIDFIPPQLFTGKPVYVIPSVSLRSKNPDGTEEITDLVFMKDYTVSYKNNTEIGVAAVTIQGIGKYKGKTMITFNIQKNL
jgi:hypothetical protein